MSDNGRQQISIYYKQDLRSVYGNQMLYNLFKPGCYNSRIKLSIVDSSTIKLTIAKNSIFMFKDSYIDTELGETTPKEFITKIFLAEDAIININLESAGFVPAVDAPKMLVVKVTWQFSTDINLRYAVFDIDIVSEEVGESDNTVYIAYLLNNEAASEAYNNPGGNSTNWLNTIKISYKDTLNYRVMESFFNQNNNFQILQNYNCDAIIIPKGEALISSTYCKIKWDTYNIETDGILLGLVDKSLLELQITLPNDENYCYIAPASNIGIAIGNSQIDILTIRPATFDEIDGGEPRPVLEWSSIEATGTIDLPSLDNYDLVTFDDQSKLLDFIKNLDLQLSSSGKILLIVVRSQSRLIEDDSIILPHECVIFTNFKEQIGKFIYDNIATIPIR